MTKFSASGPVLTLSPEELPNASGFNIALAWKSITGTVSFSPAAVSVALLIETLSVPFSSINEPMPINPALPLASRAK